MNDRERWIAMEKRMSEKKMTSKFQEYARKQGCPQEAVDKIPEMIAAMIAQALDENYSGPTPEEVNPDFFK